MLVEAKGPRWLFDIPKTRALLVVAHSDDETIFAGGLDCSESLRNWNLRNLLFGT